MGSGWGLWSPGHTQVPLATPALAVGSWGHSLLPIRCPQFGNPCPKCSTADCARTRGALWLSWAMRGTQHTPAASITFNKNMRQQLTGLLSQAALPTPFSPLTWMTKLEGISSVTGICEVKGQGRTSILYCSFISEKFYKNLRFAWQQSKHNKILSLA